MAVSLGETLPGPNGFRRIPSSSNLSCCNNCALNSSNPSKASALCWYDEVSNLLCLESEDPLLEASAAVGLRSEESLPFSPSVRNIWMVHLSFVMDRSTKRGVAEEPWADDSLWIENKGSSEEANGNSAILSIRGALTEISGDSTRWRMLIFRLWGVSNAAKGRDTLREGWAVLSAGVRDDWSWHCEHKN